MTKLACLRHKGHVEAATFCPFCEIESLQKRLGAAEARIASLREENARLGWAESNYLEEQQRKRDREIGDMGGGG